MSDGRFGDVIVLVPGILGSVLERCGKIIWGPNVASVLALLRTGGGALALDATESAAGEAVQPTQLMPDMHLIPGFWKIDGYARLEQQIGALPGVRRGENFFTFPYDWRLDNRLSAQLLADAARTWLDDWRRSSNNCDARLILVAHSMGGLVSRYFLEVDGGWRDARALITLGTPFRGSLNALIGLSNGLAIPFLGAEAARRMAEVMRGFPSVYQLLPRYPCVDLGDGEARRIEDIQALPGLDTHSARRHRLSTRNHGRGGCER